MILKNVIISNPSKLPPKFLDKEFSVKYYYNIDKRKIIER